MMQLVVLHFKIYLWSSLPSDDQDVLSPSKIREPIRGSLDRMEMYHKHHHVTLTVLCLSSVPFFLNREHSLHDELLSMSSFA